MGVTVITPSSPAPGSGVGVGCISAEEKQENRTRSAGIIRRDCFVFIDDNLINVVTIQRCNDLTSSKLCLSIESKSLRKPEMAGVVVRVFGGRNLCRKADRMAATAVAAAMVFCVRISTSIISRVFFMSRLSKRKMAAKGW